MKIYMTAIYLLTLALFATLLANHAPLHHAVAAYLGTWCFALVPAILKEWKK